MAGGFRDYGKYATLGISWVLTTAVYLYLGYRGGAWLDARFDTTPIFFVVGILLGMLLSVGTLVKELQALTGEGRKRPRGDGAGVKNDRVREKNNMSEGSSWTSAEDEGEAREGTKRKGPLD